MSDADVLSRGHLEHLGAVRAVLGPNAGLAQSEPARARGPRRRYPEADRRMRQLQRRLKAMSRAADAAGQPGLGALAELALKESEGE